MLFDSSVLCMNVCGGKFWMIIQAKIISIIFYSFLTPSLIKISYKYMNKLNIYKHILPVNME